MRTVFIFILFSLCLISNPAFADGISDLKEQVKGLTQTVQNLQNTVEIQQKEINSLKEARDIKPPVTVAQAVSKPSPQKIAIPSKLIPEIGAVADVVYKMDSSKEDSDGKNRLSLRELELVLGSNVDPYSRLDATVAFSEDGAELEEAYLTRFGLPFDTTARIGRFKPKIGKVLALHRDSLDTVDEPLVIQRYFGEEGMSKTGLDFAKLIDIPSPFVHQFAFGVIEGGNGEGGSAFGSLKRLPTIYAHLKNYRDITEKTGLEIGNTYAIGSNDGNDAFKTHVVGLDATLIHHLNPNQDLKFQSETFYLDREHSFIDMEDPDTGEIIRHSVDGNVWGTYGLVDFRFNPQWAAGFRYDYVELVNNSLSNPDKADSGYTGYLTFYQSEFARWRIQGSHYDLANGEVDNQVMLQGTFAIGEHKHKIQ